jgi:serine/threonine-protein kinase
MTHPLPPSLRDRFTVLGELGRGSFGRVLEVRDKDGTSRALKLLEGELDLQRLGRELTASQAIRHPHVLDVLDVGLVDGVGFLLMERADGTLEEWIADPGRVPEAWEALRQVAAGLAALHAEGIVHRDLKPENVMMVGGAAKLGDLGLAKGGDLRTLTEAGWVMGTPAYMAPEQARGDHLTPAADVFALGVMLFQVAAGRLPYPSTTPRRLLPVLARGGPMATGEVPANVPEVVRACLDPDPARRPSAASLATSLGPAPRAAERAPPKQAEATRRLVPDRVVSPGAPAVTPSKGVAARNMTATFGRNLLGVGALALFVAGVLTSLGPSGSPSPEPPPSPSGTTEAPERVWPEALGEEYAARMRRALEQAKESFVDESGTVHTLDEVVGSPPSTWEPLLPDDPARFVRVVENLPELAAWYAWLAAGGAVEDLREEVRQELRELDARFRREGQTEPYAPWLDLWPATRPVSARGVFGEPNSGPGGPPLDGWSGTFLEQIRLTLRAQEEARDEVVAYFEGRPSGFPGDRLEPLGMRTAMHLDDPIQARRMVHHLDEYLASAPWREVLLDWYRPFTTTFTSLTYAAARAIREHPEDAPQLIPLAEDAFVRLAGGRYGGWWGLPPEALTGGPLEGALPLVYRALFMEQRLRTNREFGSFLIPLYAARAEAWAEIFQAPDADTVLPTQPWYPWLIRALLRSQADADRPWAELVALKERYAQVVAAMPLGGQGEVILKYAETALENSAPLEPAVAEGFAADLERLRPHIRSKLALRVPKVIERLRSTAR